MTKKYSALVIDDEIDLAEIISFLIQKRFDCTITGSVKDISDFSKESFDVVLCDLFQPSIPPKEIVPFIKKNIPGAVIFLMSGSDHGDPLVQTALSQGAEMLITKPISDPDGLIRTLENFLKKKKHIRQ